ncbi:hypothetical protein [Fredinandcohnia quinoae]|nr:hypothetical protein [Fredinandcohnia sp. SECRCQ15]
MTYNQGTSIKISNNGAGTEFKIVESNMSDPTEGIFAVVTPIKKQ